MKTEFVTVLTDVYCKWNGVPPRYRVYVNHELFAERTWPMQDIYLEEMLQIQAPAGKYIIRYELVDNSSAVLTVRNQRIGRGPGRILDKLGTLEIQHAGT
jgi:hypothetical protein